MVKDLKKRSEIIPVIQFNSLLTSLVIKDQIDIYNLMRFKEFFQNIIRDRVLCIYANKHISVSVIDEIMNLYKPIRIECYIVYPPNNIKKYLIGVLRFLSYIKHSSRSTSCLQKSLEHIGFPIKWYASMNVIKKHKQHKIDTKDLEDFFSIIKLNNLLLYMRSDSIYNMSVPVHKNDIRANFIRNIDTPFMKGRPVIDCDYVINPYPHYLTQDCFFQFSSHVLVPIHRRPIPRVLKLTEKKILYSCSSEKFVPNEFVIVKKLAEICNERNVRLDILPHPSYDAQSLSKIISIQNTKIVNAPLNTQSHVEIFNVRKQLLRNYNVIISTLSSIFVDDDICENAELIYIIDPNYVKYPNLYLREHFQKIIKVSQVKLCRNVNQFNV